MPNNTYFVEFYRKAAEQGDVSAQFNLGFLYAKGQDVPQDYAKAAAWFGKAAEQGDAKSQYVMGHLYEQGKGVPQDDAKAAEWFRKAAAQGYAKDAPAKAETADKKIQAQILENMRNSLISMPSGRQYALLAGMPTADPKRYICLMRRLGEKSDGSLQDNSLWNVEVPSIDEDTKWRPYNGADSNDLIQQLLHIHHKTALEDI